MGLNYRQIQTQKELVKKLCVAKIDGNLDKVPDADQREKKYLCEDSKAKLKVLATYVQEWVDSGAGEPYETKVDSEFLRRNLARELREKEIVTRDYQITIWKDSDKFIVKKSLKR